jgi:ABC-type dipeptide/oligopeptide/nickel transport system permease component
MFTKYIARRLLITLVQLAAITLAVFFLIRLLPADPVARLVGMMASQDAYNSAKSSLGLDKPVLEQLGTYLGVLPGTSGLLEGDLGTSWVTSSPIASEIAQFFPITLELITYSFLLALIVAVPVGMLSAIKPGGIVDRLTFGYGLFAGAQPEFWWGLIFIFFFFFQWHVAPAPLGRLDPLTPTPPTVTGLLTVDSLLAGQFDIFLQALYHLMLPVVTLAFVLSGPIIKMVRQNMVRVLQSDFILYARAAGLPERRVAMYTLRGAFAPSMTLVGILFGYMLGGAVLVEQVFSLGGLGQYAVRSILSFDYPAIQGIVLTITAFSLLIYLLIDILHVLLDPRVSF